MLKDWGSTHKNALHCYKLKKQIIAKFSESSVTYPLPILVRIKEKKNNLSADKTTTLATKNRKFSSFGDKSRKCCQKLIVMR